MMSSSTSLLCNFPCFLWRIPKVFKVLEYYMFGCYFVLSDVLKESLYCTRMKTAQEYSSLSLKSDYDCDIQTSNIMGSLKPLAFAT